jgi:hypothetical protein
VIDRFASALCKIDRARKHTEDLEAEIRAFWAADPYEIEMVGTPFASRCFYRVKRIAALPESIPLIVGDAVHNIRSALDHFAWAAVSPQERGVHTYFPVWSSAAACTQDKWQKQVRSLPRRNLRDYVRSARTGPRPCRWPGGSPASWPGPCAAGTSAMAPAPPR